MPDTSLGKHRDTGKDKAEEESHVPMALGKRMMRLEKDTIFRASQTSVKPSNEII